MCQGCGGSKSPHTMELTLNPKFCIGKSGISFWGRGDYLGIYENFVDVGHAGFLKQQYPYTIPM